MPIAFWLMALIGSAVTAGGDRSLAVASLERPASGALLAWAVAEVCSQRGRWLNVLRALAFGGFGIALIALAEASGSPFVHDWLAAMHDGAIPIGDVPRVAATLSHPNEAAMVLELCLPPLVVWSWTARSGWRVPILLAAASTLLAIVLTFSRAGIATALASLVVLGALCAASRERRRLVQFGTLTLIVPLAIGWAALADQGLERRLLAGIDESSATQPPRTEFWSAALEMARDHPLLGVGPDNFRWQFTSYSGVAADNLGIHAHNQYLETLADTGVVGLLSFLLLVAALVRLSVQRLGDAAKDSGWERETELDSKSQRDRQSEADRSGQRDWRLQGDSNSTQGWQAENDPNSQRDRQPDHDRNSRHDWLPEADRDGQRDWQKEHDGTATRAWHLEREAPSVRDWKRERDWSFGFGWKPAPDRSSMCEWKRERDTSSVGEQRLKFAREPRREFEARRERESQRELQTPCERESQRGLELAWMLGASRSERWSEGPIARAIRPGRRSWAREQQRHLRPGRDRFRPAGWERARDWWRGFEQSIGSTREPSDEWPWRAALLASLTAWLVHAVFDDFERFWPASIAFWLIVGLSLSQSRDRKASREIPTSVTTRAKKRHTESQMPHATVEHRHTEGQKLHATAEGVTREPKSVTPQPESVTPSLEGVR
jgi:O-antigen ligase